MKIAVLGGGGFRTPLVFEALAGVEVDELVLHDVEAEGLTSSSPRAIGAGLPPP